MNPKPTGKCFFCGEPAPLLCDGVLAYLTENGITASRQAKAFTCDRPLCPKHVVERIRIHYNMKPRHEWGTLDYCADCVKEGRQGFASRPKDALGRLYLATEAEGRVLQRRRLFKAYLHPVLPGDPFWLVRGLA